MSEFLRTRLKQGVLFYCACVTFIVSPVVNHFRNPKVNKDYPIWFQAGEAARLGGDIYPKENKSFEFLYPPFSAWLLGLHTWAGEDATFLMMILWNIVSFGVVTELSIFLVVGRVSMNWWLRLLPTGCCLFFINDMFLLGQSNMGLLALILVGVSLLRHRWPICAGILFGMTAAMKAYPVAMLPYFLWRRQWRCSASMLASILICTLVLPATMRGFERTWQDLQDWANGMVLKQGEGGMGQRPNQSLSWQNQSIFGVGQRLLRHVDANNLHREFHKEPPLYVNVVDWDYKTAWGVILLSAAGLGLAFILVMPKEDQRTFQTDNAELGMLFTLCTVATPYCYTYYGVWLLFPFTVLFHRALMDESRLVRRVCWAAIVIANLWNIAGIPYFGHEAQAIGSMFWCEMTLLLALGWLIRRERAISAKGLSSV